MNLPLQQIRPRVLAFLQNQWFQDPPKIRKAIAASKNSEAFRRRLLAYALFAGCRSGRVLKANLGDHWCERIVWENASRHIGDFAASNFPADLKHIAARIAEENPDVVLALGAIAREALLELRVRDTRIVFEAPHPTARFIDVAYELRQLRHRLDAVQADLSGV